MLVRMPSDFPMSRLMSFPVNAPKCGKPNKQP